MLASFLGALALTSPPPGALPKRISPPLPPTTPPSRAPSKAPPATSCDHGCYDVHTTHRCDCKVTEKQCKAGIGIWTNGCGCDRTSDPGFSPCNTSKPEYGCYNSHKDHTCACDINEEMCQHDGGRWTIGCGCGKESLPPPAPAPPPLPLEGGVVEASLRAECPAASYSATIVRRNLLLKMAELTGVAHGFIHLTVGDECDTPYGTSVEAFATLSFTVACATAGHVDFVDQVLHAALVDAASASKALGIPVIAQSRTRCSHPSTTPSALNAPCTTHGQLHRGGYR